jgi:cell division septation protein DedD
MIKVNKLLMTLLVCSIATSLQAVKLEVMPTVGKAFKAEDDSLKDDEILYGVRGTVFLNEEIAVQAALETSTDNEIKNHPGAKTDIERVSANIIYEKDLGSRIRPYGIIGVGNETTHGLTAPSTGDGSQGFINAGAGLKFGLSKHIDLVTEARWLRKLTNDDNDIIATIGLGVNTGSSKCAAPVAAVPSVTETSDVQNAINLAEFRKLSQKKATEAVVKKPTVVETVTTTTHAVVEESVPADAIVLDEDATVTETVETSFVEEAPASEDGYYVQMAALFKGNGESLIRRLEQKNYPYVIHNVTRGGKKATLILVGPYHSKLEASVASKYLKRLKKDAFIYHMN